MPDDRVNVAGGKVMLYIIQVILSGSAETPQVHTEEAAARSAFVACARKYWAQSYAAYCERQGVDSLAVSSARSFVDSFDLADRSRIHFWSVEPEGAAAGGAVNLEPLQAQHKQVERLADDLDRAAGAVRGGLAELAAAIAALTGEATAGSPSTADAPDTRRPTLSAPPTLPEAAKTYDAREWQAYVATISNMCVNRSEFHLFTRHDWRQAVYGSETSLEYRDWVAETIGLNIEAAHRAGYAVIPDPDSPGRYRFRSPAGEVGDVSSEAEGEAWCRAGLHLKGKEG